MGYILVCSLCNKYEKDLDRVSCVECGGLLHVGSQIDMIRNATTTHTQNGQVEHKRKAALRHERKRLRKGRKGRIEGARFLAEYIKFGIHCPFCKSTFIYMEDEAIRACVGKDEEVYASRPMTCFTCSAIWFDVYKLFDIDILQAPKG